MSLTLNMVGGGGGGGLLPTDAVLRVQAPAQSTVTISKGTTIKTDLGHENAIDPSIYDYYFFIHQNQFDSVNPWTVTASLSQYYDAVDTIIIDSADEYDVTLQYKLFLYDLGDENISITGGLQSYPYKTNGSGSTVVTPTITRGETTFTIVTPSSPNYGTCTLFTENKIDLTSYKTMKINVTNIQNTRDVRSMRVTEERKNEYNSLAATSLNSTGEHSVDITNISGLLYPVINLGGSNSIGITFNKWWLE